MFGGRWYDLEATIVSLELGVIFIPQRSADCAHLGLNKIAIAKNHDDRKKVTILHTLPGSRCSSSWTLNPKPYGSNGTNGPTDPKPPDHTVLVGLYPKS